MPTKEQERKALEQIRKIVEGLGEDSYIGIAVEGCFEDAEANIENDFALSMYGRWQDAEQKIEQYKAFLDDPLAKANPPRKGKWIPITNTRLVECECGFITDRLSDYNFCPNCGAVMEKGEEDV